ncbi:MAG TPA: site-specific integrase [Gaiellaceae bacterium]|jgi:integrase
MSRSKANDPTIRRPTRHRGITYRERIDGSRTYSVYFKGRYHPVEGGEAEAVAKQAELRGRAARGEAIQTPSRATFGEVAEQWFESKRHLRPWTRKAYRAALDTVLIPRFGNTRLTAITAEHVAALIRDLERKKLSYSTIENYLLPLSGTLGFAVRRGLIGSNPCSLLTNDDRPQRHERRQDHVWSDEEIDALINSSQYLARQPASRYDYTPLLRTALYTGMRLGELIGLRWRDVDLQEGAIYVREQYTRLGEYASPKTKAAVRRIPLSDEMKTQLAALKLGSHHSRDTDPVFAARNGKPLGHRNATRRGFEAAAEHAEIEGVSFHSMRHAFASRMIHRGISSTVLAALMGHESSAITERRYVHLFDRQRTDDVVRQAMAAT